MEVSVFVSIGQKLQKIKLISNCNLLFFVIDSILLHIFPDGSFAKTFNQLTNNGRFRVAIKGMFSKFYKLKRGSAQGDPPSGSKFIITNHIFIKCLISEKLKHDLLFSHENVLHTCTFTKFSDKIWTSWQSSLVNELFHWLVTKTAAILEIKYNMLYGPGLHSFFFLFFAGRSLDNECWMMSAIRESCYNLSIWSAYLHCSKNNGGIHA